MIVSRCARNSRVYVITRFFFLPCWTVLRSSHPVVSARQTINQAPTLWLVVRDHLSHSISSLLNARLKTVAFCCVPADLWKKNSVFCKAQALARRSRSSEAQAEQRPRSWWSALVDQAQALYPAHQAPPFMVINANEWASASLRCWTTSTASRPAVPLLSAPYFLRIRAATGSRRALIAFCP